jgi:signal transduction histidine kinase
VSHVPPTEPAHPAATPRVSRAELRAAARHAFRRRAPLWISLAVAVVTLGVMLALQFFWLADLERTSSIAMRATQRKLAEGLAKEVAYYYKSLAEKALNVHPSYFLPSRESALAALLAQRHCEGTRRLFAFNLQGKVPLVLVPNPETEAGGEVAAKQEFIAVWAACSPWTVVAKKTGGVVRPGLHVDERDPAYRVVVRPITDDASRLVGLVGMVLDESHFRSEVLPKAIASSLPHVERGSELQVWVCDERGQKVVGNGPGCGPKTATRVPLMFAFTNWTVSLNDPRATPEAWAQRSFVYNVALSVALAVVLIGGIGLTLRAAGREMRLAGMKSDFVSNVSHELRTPLASIRVFGELMRLGRVTEPEKVREYGEHIEIEGRRLTQLVDNILDFSRIESGRKVYHFQEGSIEAIVREVVAAFTMRLRGSGFAITVEGPVAPLPPLPVDAAALDHAISNLLDNAVKYSGDGRDIAVRLSRSGESVLIAVRDRGIGIAASEQKRIFERFHRVSTGAVHEVRGVGLGLSIVDHIVRAHGGAVGVASEPGAGSTFTISLPIPPQSGTTIAAPAGGGEATEPLG